jgi:hypothetical protein
MKRLKIGIVTLVIAALAITAAAVAAQTPSGTPQPPAQGQDQGQPPTQGQGRPGRGQGFGFEFFGFGGEFQVIADTLGVDLATLRTDLQGGKTIADIAKDKNVELSAITDAIVAKQADNLKTAVTDGRLTQAQADAQTALMKANLDALYNRKFELPQTSGNRPDFGQRANPVLDVIAEALGEDSAALQTDLKAGKSIADIAKDKNVELSTVVDAVVAQRQTALTTAVTNGQLTQEQADAQIALLKADLNAAFAQPMTGRGGFFGGRGDFGPMGGFGGFGRPGRGNGGPMGPGGNGNGGPGNNPPPAEVTPEATSTANA